MVTNSCEGGVTSMEPFLKKILSRGLQENEGRHRDKQLLQIW